MNKKKSIAIEAMWLILAILSVLLGVYKYNIIGVNGSLPFFIITIVSVIMYSLRKYIRKKSSK